MKVTFTPTSKNEHNLPGLIDSFMARGQSFWQVIDDTQLVDEISAYAKSVEGRYEFIVVLGIGGSALGTQTLRDTLLPLNGQSKPQLIIVDNIDPELLRSVEQQIDISKTLFLPITKSGGTPETLALMAYFEKQVEQKGLAVRDHFTYITDPEAGYLRERVDRENLVSFPIPPAVGGRFSVLTAVGLVPAALCGIDIKPLLAGAQEMRDLFLSPEKDKNVPYQMAAWQLEVAGKIGGWNVVVMPYIQQLKTFAEWYAQLLAESTGKRNSAGDSVGFTPIGALGATDQHSQLQLYAQGPNDKQYIFLNRKNTGKKIEIPDMGDHAKVAILKGLDFGTLLQAEFQATKATLQEIGRPVAHIEMDTIDAKMLGSLFLLFEGATAFLGEMMDINAFDQPGVERSKVLTREYLVKN